MKNTERKIAIAAAIIVMACMLLIIFAPFANAQKSAKQYHAKLQKEYSFENRMKNNKAFTISSAKDNLKMAKKNARKERSKDRKIAKIRAKREQIAAIKP